MKRPTFAAFRNASTRPRAIMWSGVVVLMLAGVAVAGGVIASSTRTFCAEVCHHVQDDAIASYEASAHANISCLACHEPANGTPIQLIAAKLKSFTGEMPMAIAGTFSFPLNKGSAYALSATAMNSKQCTQCHGTNRKITPSAGIKIDHAIHAKNGISCASCHNRVAHDESGLTLKLAGNVKHADFMKMDACFRCHGLEGQHEAPGKCSACHSDKFDLLPATHKTAEWLAGGHSDAAAESLKEYGRASVESEELLKEGIAERLARPVEHCSTCHTRAFCKDCHRKLARNLAQASNR